jgi:hypothetical protein
MYMYFMLSRYCNDKPISNRHRNGRNRNLLQLIYLSFILSGDISYLLCHSLIVTYLPLLFLCYFFDLQLRAASSSKGCYEITCATVIGCPDHLAYEQGSCTSTIL